MHVSDTNAHSELLRSLDTLYNSSPYMKKYVDIHLVYDPFDRQFNMWRNVAKFFARTEVSLAFSLCRSPFAEMGGKLTFSGSNSTS